MKQTTTEVIQKLEIEYNELAGRIGSLERFMICEDYPKVTDFQRVILIEQRKAMVEYKDILLKRLIDLRIQEKHEKEMTTCAPAEGVKRPEAEDGTQSN